MVVLLLACVLGAMAEEGVTVGETADIALLSGETEKALLKQIAQFCEEIKLAARDYDPSRINRYVTALAGDFHRFYNACRIKGEADELVAARLKLADATRSVIANCLGLLGVTAPVKM